MTPEERNEERQFRAWLRTLDRLPAEVPGDETWNGAVLMAAFDRLNQPLPQLDEQ